MDLNLSSELQELQSTARRAFATDRARAGAFGEGTASVGDRTGLLDIVADLGTFELDVLGSDEEALAAALVVQEIGGAAGAAPVVARLAAVAAGRGGLLHPIGKRTDDLLLNHVDLGLRSEALGPDGSVFTVQQIDEPQPTNRPMVPYATRVQLDATGDTVPSEIWDLTNIITAFYAVGSVTTAIDLACEHVSTRFQFGQPLASFQGVKNRVADAVIAQRGLTELALYTLWRYHSAPDRRRVDALMLRYHELVSTREIFTSVHQLHASIGFCYEYPLLQHSLGLQFDRQVPLNEAGCLAVLRSRFREIETNYEQLPPAWSVMRADRVAPNVSAEDNAELVTAGQS